MEHSSFELEVRIAAADGFVLRGWLYDPFPSRASGRAALFCAGGGIPARVYRRFAAWLAAAHGLPVLLFDYRGIGRSRPESLRGFDARLEDWAEQDCAAAIAWLRARYPGARLAGITHSIGALVLAATPNARELERFLLIAAHTGYCGDYHPRWRLLMTLFWHRFVPGLAALVGYFPGRRLGLGEDLPGGFARQWGRRREAAIEIDSPRVAAGLARLRELRGAALALTFTDDGFATPGGTQRMLAQLPQLKVEHRVLSPEQAHLRRIGHFGFFRPYAEATLWRPVGEWLLNPA
jgi:predicted alpha/beta hydrolase